MKISSWQATRILPSIFVLFIFSAAWSQTDSDTLSKKDIKKQKKTEKIEQGKPLVTVLGGPAYTPEMGFTLAGIMMVTYKTNPSDTLIQRSSSPVTFGVGSLGGIFFSSKNTTFWFKDKLRINANFWYKDMPDHYWGVGYENGSTVPKSDTTTAYDRVWWWFNPQFLWQFKPGFFLGLNVDYNYTEVNNPSEGVQNDPHYIEYGPENLNSGLGIIARYDSRDVPVNPYSGTYFDFTYTNFSPTLGGDNSYQVYLIDFRKYYQVGKPGRTIAFQAKSRIATGEVPYAEMSMLGTPWDLRGYTWGRYRDKALLLFMAEYRHMFEGEIAGVFGHGVVAWMGTGSVSPEPGHYDNWLPNFGFGYRLEIQPRMNVRFDFGIGRETSGVYFSFNEAF